MSPFLIPPPRGQPHSVFEGTNACWLFLCFHNPACVHGLSHACIYTRGLGTPTEVLKG